MRYCFAITAVTASLLTTGCVAGKVDTALSDKPNIIFVMADDLAWADVGFNDGPDFYETPNLDAMAKEGVVFDRFYPGGPNCAPSRATIVTGMYTPRTQLYQPGGSGKGDVTKMRWKVPTRKVSDPSYRTFVSNNNRIDANWQSIAEVLKPAGYATARIGKWHLGPDEQGFDVSTNDGLTPFKALQKSFYNDINVAEQLTERTIEFIENHRNRPFFIYLNHWEVHVGLAAKQSIVDKYKRKKKIHKDRSFDWKPVYAAEIEVVDTSLGRIRRKLAELGLDENTLIIFTSDNGGHAPTTPNRPLKSAKGSLYEGGIRTAFVAVWPRHVKPGTRSAVPVNGVDILPTFAEIAGAALPTTQPVDGRSVLSLLQGRGAAALIDRALFWHYPMYLAGSSYARNLPVYGTDKLMWRAVPGSAMVKGDWKLIHFYEYDKTELYNLRDDPGEQRDLFAVRPEIGESMKAELMAWVKDTDAPVPAVPNPKFSP